MDELKKEISKVAKNMRDQNKAEWGRYARYRLKVIMTKSQMAKSEFSVVSYKVSEEVKGGLTLEESILNSFGKFGKFISREDNYGGIETTKRYLFKLN